MQRIQRGEECPKREERQYLRTIRYWEQHLDFLVNPPVEENKVGHVNNRSEFPHTVQALFLKV